MPTPAALILSGGLGLGAYQLGAISELTASGLFEIEAIAGGSIGAMNGAIIAGNPPETRIERLHAFWRTITSDTAPNAWSDPLEWSGLGTFRHARNWTSAIAARLVGVPRLFRPRTPTAPAYEVATAYDSSPARDTLARFIDFDRLNSGETRFCAATTDIETGESVLFDTAAGDRIEPDHLVASGGLMPAFPPLRIGGRLLGDAGFSANAPLDPFLATSRRAPVPSLCILIDLYAPDVRPSGTLESSAERATDLQFACQTVTALDRLERERALEARLAPQEDAAGTDLLYLSYQSSPNEAGPEKTFDFSRASIADRAATGARDAQEAISRWLSLPEPAAAGLRVHRIRRPA